MSKMKRTAAAIAPVAVMLTLASCGNGSATSTAGGSAATGSGGNTHATITVGFDNPLAFANNIGVLVASDKGFFQQHGLQVKTIAFNGGSDVTKALIGGSVQVQAGVGFDAVAAQAKSVDAKIFYGVAQQSDFAFFANPTTGVTSLKQLKGKKVAISSFGSYTDFLTKRIAAAQGLPADSVTEVPLGPNPAIVSSVTSGSTVGTWQPAELEALFKGKAHSIGTVANLDIPSQYSSLIASGSYITSHHQALSQFAAAMKQATAWIKTHRTQTIALAVKDMKLPPPIAAASYKADASLLTPDGAVNVAGLKAMAEAVPALTLGPKAPAVSSTYTTSVTGGS